MNRLPQQKKPLQIICHAKAEDLAKLFVLQLDKAINSADYYLSQQMPSEAWAKFERQQAILVFMRYYGGPIPDTNEFWEKFLETEQCQRVLNGDLDRQLHMMAEKMGIPRMPQE